MRKKAQVWSGNWERRILDAVGRTGRASVTDYFLAHPADTYRRLIQELGCSCAPIQLLRLLYTEAKRKRIMRWAARDTLAREINESFPSGWGIGDEASWNRVMALSAWSSGIIATGESPDLKPILDRIMNRLVLDAAPVGWMPNGPDDSVILAIFDDVWPQRQPN